MDKLLLFHNNSAPRNPRTYQSFLNETVDSVIRETITEFPYGNRNTGTYLMTDTLKKIIRADKLIPRFYEFNEHVDTVITNIFHRIGGNIKVDIPYWNHILKHADRVVPLSMGFAFVNGEIASLDKSLEYLLHSLSERVELGAVSYTHLDVYKRQG